MSEPTKITFTGSDYSPIADACAGKDDPRLPILKEFLNKWNGKSAELIVNKSGKTEDTETETDSRKKKLYDPDFNGGYFGGLVGVLRDTINYEGQDYDVTLQIKSRMDGKQPFFLSTMLLAMSGLEPTGNEVLSSMDDMFDYLMLFLFKSKLEQAYIKGAYRTYRRFERNDDRLRGSVDVARHIKLNMGQNNGKIAYAYRENTADNYLNHLILEAERRLRRKFPELAARLFADTTPAKDGVVRPAGEILAELRNLLGFSNEDHSRRTLMSKNVRPISHPYYSEYEELRQVCMMILRSESVSFFDGNSEDQVQGVLFYLPDLWEKFLEKSFQLPEGVTVKAQKKILVCGSHPTYPDFVFFADRKPFMILDAKFKPKWEEGFDLDDYTKCIRDMNSINAHCTGVIYPAREEAKCVKNQISEYNPNDCFWKFPVLVPDSTKARNYDEWSKDFQGAVKNVMSKENGIKEAISEELKRCEKT